VPDRILASSASSSTQLASFHYTDAKPSVDPIEEAFLNTLLERCSRRKKGPSPFEPGPSFHVLVNSNL